MPVRFDAAGISETSWAIPQDARLGEYHVDIAGSRQDAMDQAAYALRAGEFRVEQYRVPTMRAVIQPPSRPLVRPKDVTLDLFVTYLAGGGAARAPAYSSTK